MSLAEEEILDEGLYEHYAFTADPGQEQMRIDKWLMHKIANASRSKIQAGIESGAVVVNDKPTKSNYKIKPNDHVRVLLPTAPRDTEVYPENIPINIVYEDDDLLVVNKVAGMVVHPGHNNYSGTLVNALVYHFGRNFQQKTNTTDRDLCIASIKTPLDCWSSARPILPYRTWVNNSTTTAFTAGIGRWYGANPNPRMAPFAVI